MDCNEDIGRGTWTMGTRWFLGKQVVVHPHVAISETDYCSFELKGWSWCIRSRFPRIGQQLAGKERSVEGVIGVKYLLCSDLNPKSLNP